MRTLMIAMALLALGAPAEAIQRQTDAQIRAEMIRESISRYSGSCPCPYSTTRNGSRCGGRSAYSRPGGASPLCYASDVSDSMVADYRQRTGR